MIEIRQSTSGCSLAIHVTPGAKKTAVGGEHGDALRVSVNAPPDKGKANKAVIEALAEALNLRRGDLEITAGDTSRRKTVFICGLTELELRERLQSLATGS